MIGVPVLRGPALAKGRVSGTVRDPGCTPTTLSPIPVYDESGTYAVSRKSGPLLPRVHLLSFISHFREIVRRFITSYFGSGVCRSD